jgi:pyrrolidone-carboxylate peptidase
MILLTAFLPFGTEPNGAIRRVNVSQQALMTLREEYGNALNYLVMSVDKECTEQFDDAFSAADWEAVILTGECSGHGPVRLEQSATDPSDPTAQGRRVSDLASVDLARKCGAALTNECGRYFCNVVYHHALGKTRQAVFVHLPKGRRHSEHTAVLRRLIQLVRAE